MGADGFIVDPTENIAFMMRCHRCGRVISPRGTPPCEYHADCIAPDGRLAVNLDIENYEER